MLNAHLTCVLPFDRKRLFVGDREEVQEAHVPFEGSVYRLQSGMNHGCPPAPRLSGPQCPGRGSWAPGTLVSWRPGEQAATALQVPPAPLHPGCQGCSTRGAPLWSLILPSRVCCPPCWGALPLALQASGLVALSPQRSRLRGREALLNVCQAAGVGCDAQIKGPSSSLRLCWLPVSR